MDRYIGLDAHASSCTVAVLGPSGRKLQCQALTFLFPLHNLSDGHFTNQIHQSVPKCKLDCPSPGTTTSINGLTGRQQL